MGVVTKIEWTDSTWNCIRGCSVVSEGCRNCYAMQVAARFSGEGQAYEGLAYRNESGAHWTGKVRLIEEHLEDPLRWKRPRKIFVNSMSDLFHESIPDEWIDRIFAVMALGDWHTYQVLTKRPQRMRDYLSRPNCQLNVWNAALAFAAQYPRIKELANRHRVIRHGLEARWPIPNVWLGVSVEDQKTADERIPLLLETPAAVHWISAEPLIGPTNLNVRFNRPYTKESLERALVEGATHIDWVVVGGESGTGARPMHPDWVRSIRDQCQAAGVPFYFKQWGAYHPGFDTSGCNHPSSDGAQGPVAKLNPPHVDIYRCGLCQTLHDPEQSFAFNRLGKKAAGHLLDGREWREFPECQRLEARG